MIAFTGRPVLRVLILPVVLIALTACGDDGGSTTAPPSDAATTAPDQTTTVADQTTITPGPISGDTAAWCAAVVEFDEYVADLPDATTTEEFDDLLAEILPRFRLLASAAPDAIRVQTSIIVVTLEEYLDGDDTAILDPDYFDAFERFEEYVFDVCGYELVG
jgi:predicted small lipoprotein YifL